MSANGIIDESVYTLPETKVDEARIKEEKQILKFVSSKEFEALREHFETRIKFYQQYLPDGRPISTVALKESREMWPVANAIIAELTAIISEYEFVADGVKDKLESRRV